MSERVKSKLKQPGCNNLGLPACQHATKVIQLRLVKITCLKSKVVIILSCTQVVLSRKAREVIYKFLLYFYSIIGIFLADPLMHN